MSLPHRPEVCHMVCHDRVLHRVWDYGDIRNFPIVSSNKGLYVFIHRTRVRMFWSSNKGSYSMFLFIEQGFVCLYFPVRAIFLCFGFRLVQDPTTACRIALFDSYHLKIFVTRDVASWGLAAFSSRMVNNVDYFFFFIDLFILLVFLPVRTSVQISVRKSEYLRSPIWTVFVYSQWSL